METRHKLSKMNNFSVIATDWKLPGFFKDQFDLTTLTIIVLFLVFNSLSTFGQSSCQADFDVYKSRNIRSVPLDGTYYTMVITNKTPSRNTYSLSAKNINSTCSNTDGSSTSNNVDINSTFLDMDKNRIDKIEIDGGQSVKFLVRITVPTGTALNKWCCTQIVASSTQCSNYRLSTVLHTLVINPLDE
ncbi:hypothetical protein [Flavobacterium sp.]|uniref:hypothetical protein n=1 Tax=Flavobacterium sp. TaxID=239 RepID=UPI003D6B8B74